MASPQVENGYIKISTELFKEIYFRLDSPAHLKLVLFVIRFTYGYKRKEFDTNLTSIGKAVRYTPDYCRERLIEMSDKCRLIKAVWKSPYIVTLSLNKNYDQWKLE